MSKSPDSDPSPVPPAAADAGELAIQPSAQRKTKKRARREAAGEDRDQLDANGRERPRFLRAFPDDPELAKLSRAFEAGNYAYVREHAPEVAARAGDDEVRRAALELAERIKPDPLIKYLLMLSIALLAYLVIHAYGSHGH
jgi:hypothetical protein